MNNNENIIQSFNEEIIFYAIVENESQKKCIPFSKCLKFFEKFNLKFIDFEIFQNFKNRIELFTKIKQIQKEISESNMNEIGKGNIINLVSENISTGIQEVLIKI